MAGLLIRGSAAAAPHDRGEPSAATRGQTKVSVFVEVEGAGDYLPPYSGNLDIMTAAAARVGENIARAI